MCGSISHLQAIRDKQTLLVSWLVTVAYCATLMRNHTVIYNASIEGFAVWISCVLYSCIQIIL